MRTSDGTAPQSEAPRETMTMGDAASLLGVSVISVRRMCRAYEKNLANGGDGKVGLPFAWTSPTAGRRDVQGRALRGHRRPFADAVRELARASGRMGGSQICPFCDGPMSEHEAVTVRAGTTEIIGCSRRTSGATSPDTLDT